MHRGRWKTRDYRRSWRLPGPLTRTAEDLEAVLRVLGGPDEPESISLTWRLPAPRHQRLRDFRIGYVLEDSTTPVSSEIKPAFESAVRALEKAGARLKPGWPAGFSLSKLFSTYSTMLAAFVISRAPGRAGEATDGIRPYAR
jgi:amidase